MRKRKRDPATMFPTFRNMYREGGRTVQWWTSYRHQTGGWPWFSIVIHFMNWVVLLIGGGFLVWWTVEHHLSRWQFLVILLPVSLPYTILENWAKRKVKLSYLRNNRKRIRMPRNKRSGGWVRSALVFVMHQIIGTEGVVWLTTLGVFLLRSSVREVHEPWGDSALMRGMRDWTGIRLRKTHKGGNPCGDAVRDGSNCPQKVRLQNYRGPCKENFVR